MRDALFADLLASATEALAHAKQEAALGAVRAALAAIEPHLQYTEAAHDALERATTALQRVEHEMTALRVALAAVEAEMARLRAERVRWQGIVYATCAALDRALGRSAARGTGTLADAVPESIAALERERDARPSDADLRALVDVVYQSATESDAVLGTPERDRLIARWRAAWRP